MKSKIFLLTSLSIGCAVGIWISTAFRVAQEETFYHAKRDRNFLQQGKKVLREDLAFLEAHQKEIDFLKKKGWEFPKNRLVVGECLEKLRPFGVEVSYRLDPETHKDLEETISFKVTQIAVEMSAALDSEIYAFIDRLLKEFPGILVPRELTVTRQKEAENLIKSKFVVDWFAMREDGHES